MEKIKIDSGSTRYIILYYDEESCESGISVESNSNKNVWVYDNYCDAEKRTKELMEKGAECKIMPIDLDYDFID